MKKIMAMLMASALLVSCAGCNTKKEEKVEEVPTLKWIVPGDQQQDLPNVLDAVNEVLVDKLGCKLDIDIIDSGSYNEKLKLNMSSNGEFDLCYLSEAAFSDAVQKGGLLSLNDYIDKGKMTEYVPEDILKFGTYQGDVYAVPNIQIMAYANSVFIREDLAKEFGLKVDEIKGMDDLDPFLEWVKNNKPEFFPARYTASLIRTMKDYQDRYYDELVSGSVFAYEDENGKVKVVKATDYEGFWELAELKNSWFKKGYIRKDVATSYGNDWDDVNAGKYAVYTETYKPGGIEGTNAKHPERPSIEIVISTPFMKYNAGTPTMTGVSRTTKYPELAYKFLELVNSDIELYNLISFGVEGRNYEKLENGKIKIDYDSGYSANAGWKFGNQYNAYILENQPDDVWAATEEFNNNAKSSKLIGFRPDLSDIKLEISQISTVNGKYSSVHRGYDEVANYKDAYIKELRDSGIDKVVEILQKQVDEFLGQ